MGQAMSATTTSLEAVVDNISSKLRDEIKLLVDAKYEVDELACRSAAGRRLIEPFHDGAYGPRIGASFFRTVFPFSNLEPCGDSFSALAPVSQRIGASWRWTTSSVPENERPALLARLQDPARATAEGYDRAEFIWIKPLGLFLAHEGKNRVGFFRDMGAQWIPAHVAPYDYPAADRLAIYAAMHAHQTMYWVVLDGQLLEPINHPAGCCRSCGPTVWRNIIGGRTSSLRLTWSLQRLPNAWSIRSPVGRHRSTWSWSVRKRNTNRKRFRARSSTSTRSQHHGSF